MLSCLGARVISLPKHSTVFSEGSEPTNIGIVLSGAVRTQQTDYYGNNSIISEEHAGEVFCEAFACAEVESVPVSAITAEPSEIMLIDRSHVLHTCSSCCGFHQQLIYNLMRSLAEKNLTFHKKIEITSKRTTRGKILAYLDTYSKECGSKKFSIPFDRQELADYLQVERSGLSQEISRLCREGIIKSTKNRFELL